VEGEKNFFMAILARLLFCHQLYGKLRKLWRTQNGRQSTRIAVSLRVSVRGDRVLKVIGLGQIFSFLVADVRRGEV